MKKIALLITTAFVFSVASLYAQTAQTRLDNGKRLFDQSNYDGAIQELNEAIRLDSKLAEAYAYRARSYNGKRDYDRGISDANRAIQLNPQMATAYYARGNAYYNKNDYDRAIADYNDSIRLDPKFAWAYINRGNAYSKKNDYDRAIADYTEAIRLDPNNVDAYINRGNRYDDKNDYDRAIADLTEAIRLDPNNVLAYYNRGVVYTNKKDYNRAIADYEATLKLNPNHSGAENNLAIVKRWALQESASKYDPSKFTVVPSDFNPSEYTSVDLFKAASNAKNLQIASSREQAIIGQMQSGVMLGMGGSWFLQYVSDLKFVRQNGTDITFSSDDNAITQNMSIDQRSGLQAGQKVRVYYTIMRSPSTRWDVIAIERR